MSYLVQASNSSKYHQNGDQSLDCACNIMRMRFVLQKQMNFKQFSKSSCVLALLLGSLRQLKMTGLKRMRFLVNSAKKFPILYHSFGRSLINSIAELGAHFNAKNIAFTLYLLTIVESLIGYLKAICDLPFNSSKHFINCHSSFSQKSLSTIRFK